MTTLAFVLALAFITVTFFRCHKNHKSRKIADAKYLAEQRELRRQLRLRNEMLNRTPSHMV